MLFRSVVLENAIKHNIISESKPLEIEITGEDRFLIIRNTIQSKLSSGYSSGIGQKNMIKRYEMIGDDLPEFTVETNIYKVKLPLIANLD